jgi:hypothetical protein
VAFFADEAWIRLLNVEEDIMATTPATRPVDASYLVEVIEVAEEIVQRHHDNDLAEKMLALRELWETSKKRPGQDCTEALDKALAEVASIVRLHLSSELEAVTEAWATYLTTPFIERPAEQK